MEKKTIAYLAVVVAIVAIAAAVALIRPATTQTSITDLTLCVEVARTAEFTVLATETLRDLHGTVTIWEQPLLVARSDMPINFVPIYALKIPQEL